MLRLNKVSDELYIVNCKIKIWENLKWLQFKEFSCCKSWNDEMLVLQFSRGILAWCHFLLEFLRWEESNPSIWSRLWSTESETVVNQCSGFFLNISLIWHRGQSFCKNSEWWDVVFTSNLKCDLRSGLWELPRTNCASQFVTEQWQSNGLEFPPLRSITSRVCVTCDNHVALEHLAWS